MFSHFTILQIFFELILSFANLISDTLSGYSLVSVKETFIWGIGSFVINWIPGLVGVIQRDGIGRHSDHPQWMRDRAKDVQLLLLLTILMLEGVARYATQFQRN